MNHLDFFFFILETILPVAVATLLLKLLMLMIMAIFDHFPFDHLAYLDYVDPDKQVKPC